VFSTESQVSVACEQTPLQYFIYSWTPIPGLRGFFFIATESSTLILRKGETTLRYGSSCEYAEWEI